MKNLFILSIALMFYSVAFATWGHDYDLGNGKSKGTVWGSWCKGIIWRYADGSLVPDNEIICCNHLNGSYTGQGGTNCPFDWRTITPPNSNEDERYTGSKQIAPNTYVGINAMTGNVEVFNTLYNLRQIIVNESQINPNNQPIYMGIILEQNSVVIEYKIINSNELIYDSTLTNGVYGAEQIAYNTTTVINSLFTSNLHNITCFSPNPTNVNSTVNFKNLLSIYNTSITFDIYNNLGMSIYSFVTNDEDNYKTSIFPSTGQYIIHIFVNDLDIGSIYIGHINVLVN